MDPAALGRALDGWSTGSGPLYRQLADTLRRLIGSGRLPPGMRLPAERRLAEELNVSRGTVVAAYQALREVGLLRARQGSGTLVAGTAPQIRDEGELFLTTLLGLNVVGAPGAGSIDLQPAAWDDVSGLPAEAFRLEGEDATDLLATTGYFPGGLPALRQRIASYLTGRGLPTEPDEVLVTCGAHQAITLLTRLTVAPGDVVTLEELTYPGARDALQSAGARVTTVPLTKDGADLDELEQRVDEDRPRLVYLIPTVNNPTGVVMPEAARERLAAMVGSWETVVVDDESLAETLLDGPPPPPLAAFARGPESVGRIFTVGSASKTFWGGLRIGWIRGPSPAIAVLTRLKALSDLATPVVSQLIAARLLEAAPEIMPARREALSQRLTVMTELLAEHLPEWSWERPSGGLAMWVRLPGADAGDFASVALRHGVAVVPGSHCAPGGGFTDHLRLSLGPSPERLEEGIQRLRAAWRAYEGRAPASLGVIV